jgi:integrase
MWWVNGARKSRVLGFVKDMTKSKAREIVGKIVAEEEAKHDVNRVWLFGEFVEKVYFVYYSRKWKRSTRGNNMNRVSIHLVKEFRERELSSFNRDELQDLLDRKAASFSFSTVDHLRWDLKQIFDIAIADGHMQRNPAGLIFTPNGAAKPVRKTMTVGEVQTCFSVLARRERLIAKLAVLAGLRPGEIFALTWGEMNSTYVNIRQRVYKGIVDSPKTENSMRQAALSEGLLREIESWKGTAVVSADAAWVFPSERMTPLTKENVWRRHVLPKLELVGLGWVNFQVMRRTHSTLMNGLGVEGKLVADQLGHSLDVNQNVYTKSPVANRQVAVNQLEGSLRVM